MNKSVWNYVKDTVNNEAALQWLEVLHNRDSNL